ncbi:MAG TPA: Ldh family oxidoreductase [Pseudonocardia sp.]
MIVRIDQLRRDVAAILVHNGVPPDEAVVGAEMCVDAELRGHRSHGVRLVRNVLAEYAQGAPRRTSLAVVRETAVSAQVDGGFHLSWYVHRTAVDIAVTKATAVGIGLVSVRDAGVSGALGHLVERIAEAGLVGLALNSSPATVVAPGTGMPTLGTNPLAIAVPRRSDPPLVLDMATSAVAFNELRRRHALGIPLTAGAATNASGAPTTDPEEALDPASGRGRILPFGGHRGFGLALMIELMVSAGVTGRTGPDKRGPVIAEPADFSGLYLAYRPDLVGDPDAASSATERLLDELAEQGSRLPGESSRLQRAEAVANGELELDEDAARTLADLRTTARQAPVSRPSSATSPASGRS